MIVAIALLLAAGLTAILEGPQERSSSAPGFTVTSPTEPAMTEPRQPTVPVEPRQAPPTTPSR